MASKPNPWERRYLRCGDAASTAPPRPAHHIVVTKEWTGDDAAHQDKAELVYSLHDDAPRDLFYSPDTLCGLLAVKRPVFPSDAYPTFASRFPGKLGDAGATFLGVRAVEQRFDSPAIVLELWLHDASLAARSRDAMARKQRYAVSLPGVWGEQLGMFFDRSTLSLALVDVVYGDASPKERAAWAREDIVS